jgi:spore maturation protein CgeB
VSGLNIAFFGSSIISAYWNGAATYYRGLVNALCKRSHRITFFEPDAYNRQQNVDLIDTLPFEVNVYPATVDGVFESLDKAKKYSTIIKASGVGVFDELLETEILSLKGNGRTIIFWDVDAPATLDRMANNNNDYFTKLVPQYDHIFTYGGGEKVRNAYFRFGAKTCFPIYNALDPQTHFPVQPGARFKGDFGFLGNRLPDRECRVHEFFLKPARLLKDKKFLLGGSGWDNSIESPNVTILGHVFTHEHNEFNCSVSAILNVNRESMATYGYSPPTRIFEAAGAAACIITDEWEGIEKFLEPERECLVGKCGEEIAGHIKSLTEQRCRMIGESARKRVAGEHTYYHRAIDVEKILLY